MNLLLSTQQKGLLNTWLSKLNLSKNVSAKTWRVLPLTTLFHRKRDALLLLQVCFAENVTRFSLHKIFSIKTWHVLPVTSLFHRKRGAFLLLQVCFIENVTRFCCYKSVSSKTWRVFAVTRFFGQNVTRFYFRRNVWAKTPATELNFK